MTNFSRRRVTLVTLFIFLPSLLCFFSAYAIGLSGEVFFNFSKSISTLILLSGLCIGWIGIIIQERTVTASMDLKWRMVIALPLYGAMAIVSTFVVQAII